MMVLLVGRRAEARQERPPVTTAGRARIGSSDPISGHPEALTLTVGASSFGSFHTAPPPWNTFAALARPRGGDRWNTFAALARPRGGDRWNTFAALARPRGGD